MRIVFLGSSAFSLPALKILLDNRIDIPLVITRPDKPAGRGLQVHSTVVKTAAEKAGFKVVEDLPSAIELKKLKPDHLVVVAFGKMIPKEIVDGFSCINIHPSLLPKYRGPSPIQSTLLNGDTETGVTTMLLAMEMDTGDILLQERTPLDINEGHAALEERLAGIGAKLLIKTLNSDLSAIRKKQDEGLATYCKKIRNEDTLIDWHKSPFEIHNQVRAITGYTVVNGKRIKVLKTRFVDNKLEIVEVQPEGKKPMSYEEFKRGYKLELVK